MTLVLPEKPNEPDVFKQTRKQRELSHALLKLSLKKGDVVFVDRHAIDILQIPRTDLGPDHPNTTFFAVDVQPGMTLKDVIRQVDMETLTQAIIEIEQEIA